MLKALSRLCALFLLALPLKAPAFCGFYVGKADSKLFNQSSQVVLVRDGDHMVMTMSSDYEGDLKEFALVVPVPEILQKGQVHVAENSLIEHLDAYSAPRLVEYFDPSPCAMREMAPMAMGAAAEMDMAKKSAAPERAKALGVAIEASYTVGEYDIVILSAKQSDGLETWLRESGYHIPAGASQALRPYVRQGLKFFVAKVNLREQAKTGLQNLRPLQFAVSSPRFMLPLRLGMLNARGPQDLVVYLLTRQGRVESANYRTVKLPSGMDIPEYTQGDFKNFYKAMFQRQWEKEDGRAVFTEYFWNMSWCDPCASAPLDPAELKSLGVFWLGQAGLGGTSQVMLTRLRLRYARDTFPEDLVFEETKDQQNYQARYVIRHEWKGGENNCPGAEAYLRGLIQRHETEAEGLAQLTGWDINSIRQKMGLPGYGDTERDPGATPQPTPEATPWWTGLWGQQG